MLGCASAGDGCSPGGPFLPKGVRWGRLGGNSGLLGNSGQRDEPDVPSLWTPDGAGGLLRVVVGRGGPLRAILRVIHWPAVPWLSRFGWLLEAGPGYFGCPCSSVGFCALSCRPSVPLPLTMQLFRVAHVSSATIALGSKPNCASLNGRAGKDPAYDIDAVNLTDPQPLRGLGWQGPPCCAGIAG